MEAGSFQISTPGVFLTRTAHFKIVTAQRTHAYESSMSACDMSGVGT